MVFFFVSSFVEGKRSFWRNDAYKFHMYDKTEPSDAVVAQERYHSVVWLRTTNTAAPLPGRLSHASDSSSATYIGRWRRRWIRGSASVELVVCWTKCLSRKNLLNTVFKIPIQNSPYQFMFLFSYKTIISKFISRTIGQRKYFPVQIEDMDLSI